MARAREVLDVVGLNHTANTMVRGPLVCMQPELSTCFRLLLGQMLCICQNCSCRRLRSFYMHPHQHDRKQWFRRCSTVIPYQPRCFNSCSDQEGSRSESGVTKGPGLLVCMCAMQPDYSSTEGCGLGARFQVSQESLLPCTQTTAALGILQSPSLLHVLSHIYLYVCLALCHSFAHTSVC